MDSHAVFCRRDSLFHCQQYLGNDVYAYGGTQRRDGTVYKFALLAVDYQAIMEPFRRHFAYKALVDSGDAGADKHYFHSAYALDSLSFGTSDRCKRL